MLFGINADAAKTFPEICGEKQAKFKKKICGTKKNFADFQRFLWKKTAKKPTFFEIF
ncbi:hypothetical protein [Phascolarctobacterium succinatutens]|uniref:hypothetical protein n=1 Tax=Phascolarctobacterium succinatutens TaxID=626940 RepID=UPI0026EEBAF3|nr:hypothetical protein [Phascolarctobacterium succinatutens]